GIRQPSPDFPSYNHQAGCGAQTFPERYPVRTVPRWKVLLPAALLLAAGCGLSEYERKMANEQERVKRFDREMELLGDAISPPTKWDEKTQTYVPLLEMFFRPPHGISTKYDKNSPQLGIWYQYPRTAAGSDNLFQDVYLAITTDEKDLKGKALELCPGAS